MRKDELRRENSKMEAINYKKKSEEKLVIIILVRANV